MFPPLFMKIMLNLIWLSMKYNVILILQYANSPFRTLNWVCTLNEEKRLRIEIKDCNIASRLKKENMMPLKYDKTGATSRAHTHDLRLHLDMIDNTKMVVSSCISIEHLRQTHTNIVMIFG